jgi:hypothetical protein
MYNDKSPAPAPAPQPRNADLQHRDWLLFTQQNLVQSIDPNIDTSIVSTPDGGKRLILKNVTEQDMAVLQFITNTDQNNNYLYLESIAVRLENSIDNLEIPGLTPVILKMYRLSDANGFFTSSKTHIPYTTTSFNGNSVGYYIDQTTKLLPFLPNTYGIQKIFTLVLNPDECNPWTGICW